MIPSYIGLIELILGAWLLYRRDPQLTLAVMLGLGLFEASAALLLPALSDSSIPPARLMLGFLLIQSLGIVWRRAKVGQESLAANLWLLIFCAYGFVAAFILPRIFTGKIFVTPLRSSDLRNLFDVYPLVFSAQNVTTGVYLIGTGLAGLAAFAAVRIAASPAPLIRLGWLLGMVHAVLGVIGVAFKGTFWDTIVEAIRNGAYAQLDQSTGTYIRISGIMPEPSSYARFAFVWLIFNFELWLRNIAPARTGTAALMLAVVLAFSTSSTAYASLALYAIFLGLRAATFPSYLSSSKSLQLLVLAMIGILAVFAVMVVSPVYVQQFAEMFQEMTLGKTQSASGQQRAFWARQGLEAFRLSYGLGIGPGSFRSSGLISAVLGSMGVIGAISLTVHTIKTLVCARPGTPVKLMTERDAVAAASAWAAVLGLIPLVLIQASSDPGMEFAALAAIALALHLPPLPVSRSKAGLGPAAEPTPMQAPVPMPAAPQSAGWRRGPR